jgi:iron complex outermembrane recepter protein
VPSFAATETLHYMTALVPGAPQTDRDSIANDDGNWAPRWKKSTSIGWKNGAFAVTLSGRYVGPYQDYDRTVRIGNFAV